MTSLSLDEVRAKLGKGGISMDSFSRLLHDGLHKRHMSLGGTQIHVDQPKGVDSSKGIRRFATESIPQPHKCDSCTKKCDRRTLPELAPLVIPAIDEAQKSISKFAKWTEYWEQDMRKDLKAQKWSDEDVETFMLGIAKTAERRREARDADFRPVKCENCGFNFETAKKTDFRCPQCGQAHTVSFSNEPEPEGDAEYETALDNLNNSFKYGPKVKPILYDAPPRHKKK